MEFCNICVILWVGPSDSICEGKVIFGLRGEAVGEERKRNFLREKYESP